MNNLTKIDADYKTWLKELKAKIRGSQIKAAIRVNNTMLELYWSIGADIVEKQAENKWGSGVISQLSRDLREEFPNIQGFSQTNLSYMKKFYMLYSPNPILHQLGGELVEASFRHQLGAKLDDDSILHQVGGELALPPMLGAVPWRHHVEIMSRSKSLDEAIFYITQTIENGWSRAMLINFMKTNLFHKKGKAPNNFSTVLPDPQSDLASQILKDPYNFDFLMLTKNYKEKELETALIENMTKLLIELGQGFAYVGKQIPLEVGGDEYTLDLLFYHLKLRCYVAIELKAGNFSPKDLGQLGFYVAAVNHMYKTEADSPTVGMLICREKNNMVAKYALESSACPIGISEYELSELIPENYQSALPTIEEIEDGLLNLDS